MRAVGPATFIVSATAVGIAVSRAKKHMDEKEAPLLGVTAAFVFAAQMLNFPVAGGTSGHFLGALLAGVLLGPFNGCLVLTLVLIIQALVFADGGITALGSNIFLMGVVGGIGATYFFYGLKCLFPKTKRGFIAAVVVASWVSVACASVACALLLALSGTVLTVTQDMFFAAQTCSCIIVLYKGRIERDGHIEQVFSDDKLLEKCNLDFKRNYSVLEKLRG